MRFKWNECIQIGHYELNNIFISQALHSIEATYEVCSHSRAITPQRLLMEWVC
jgi:hypothetical protein